MGASAGSDQYVHRCGRTGRAGQEGRAISIYSPLEREFVNTLSDLGIRHDPELEARLTVVAADAVAGPKSTTESDGSEQQQPASGLSEAELRRERLAEMTFEQCKEELDPMVIEEAYTAYLGFYVGRTNDLCIHNKQAILDESVHYVKGFGMSEAPSLSANFLERIGFSARSMQRGAARDRRDNRFNRRGSSSFDKYDRGGNRSSSFDRFDRRDRSSSFDKFSRDGGNSRPRSFSGNFNRGNDRYDGGGSFNRYDRGSNSSRSHYSEEQKTKSAPRGFKNFN
jgi:ATP-dependent RNA helicase MSS116